MPSKAMESRRLLDVAPDRSGGVDVADVETEAFDSEE